MTFKSPNLPKFSLATILHYMVDQYTLIEQSYTIIKRSMKNALNAYYVCSIMSDLCTIEMPNFAFCTLYV